MKPSRMAVLLCTALWWCGPASAQDGEALLERLQSRFESMETMRASFTQQTRGPVFDGAGDTIRGTLTVRGEQYRLESGLRTLVNDGATLWIYDAAEGQVIVSEYVEDPYTFSITGFLYRFDERWTFDAVESAPDGWRIRLAPLDPEDFFRSVVVSMRAQDDLVTRVEVRDANDVTMIFTLADLVENPVLAEEVFRFEAPDGVEVVDLRND